MWSFVCNSSALEQKVGGSSPTGDKHFFWLIHGCTQDLLRKYNYPCPPLTDTCTYFNGNILITMVLSIPLLL